MSNRQPGDYVVNAELTDEQRDRFVADCVAAGARDYGDCDDYGISAYTNIGDVEEWSLPVDELKNRNNVTHEYKENTMTQPQLMRQIADAMERNPEGWWQEFQVAWTVPEPQDIRYRTPLTDGDFWQCFRDPHSDVRPKPRTYTLHVEDMPEHTYIARATIGGERVELQLDYPDEPTAREALEKLTKAMGGE